VRWRQGLFPALLFGVFFRASLFDLEAEQVAASYDPASRSLIFADRDLPRGLLEKYLDGIDVPLDFELGNPDRTPTPGRITFVGDVPAAMAGDWMEGLFRARAFPNT